MKNCKWSFILNERVCCLISQELVYDDVKMVFKMTKLHSEKMGVDQRSACDITNLSLNLWLERIEVGGEYSGMNVEGLNK